MVGGILQIKKGMGEMAGMDPAVESLTKESDAALADGNRATLEGAPLFQAALEAIDKDGLDAVRANRKADVQKAGTLFGKAAENFRLAAKKLDEAGALEAAGKLKAVFAAKSRSYLRYAEVKAINQEICASVLDESLKTMNEVQPKILADAKRRDDLQKVGDAATAEAQKLADEMKK